MYPRPPMAEPAGTDLLLAVVDGPAAVCDARGTIVRQNAAFASWTGSSPGDCIDVHAGRGILVLPDTPARALAMVPLAGGTWLAVPMSGETPGAAAGVCRAVGRRLERVE